nr:unnamed protein product [Callosobruchus chinensis]
MYNSQNPNLRSSKSMFKRIFYNEFNIGFSSPASDACGTCLNLRNIIKEGGKNKTTLMTELRVHKVRAKTFYTLLKENPENSMSFCFDLQQVHPLPKIPIQDAFYLRQISFYTFCCVDDDSKKPFFYTWTENQASRGCIIKYRGCSFFRFENVTQQKYLPFLKRGRKEGQLEELLIGKPIPLEKKNVKAPLEKQFNNADMQWQNLPSLEFFKPILDEGSKEAEQEYVEENEPIDDDACDCLEDDLELHL